MEIGDIMIFKEINNRYNINKVRVGYPDTKVLGDELNSATIYLTNIDEIDINAYDIVCLTDLNGIDNWYLVANYYREYVTFTQPYKYDYVVNLMSLTKKLETVILPNLSITNIGQNRTVAYYIRQARKWFNEQAIEDGIELDNIMGIPYKLNNMICPELTFNAPTLREYLDTLYSLAGCLCELNLIETPNGNKYFELSYLDLNERKGEMNRQYIDTLGNSAVADNYAKALESEIDMFVSKNNAIEYQGLKSTDYVFDSNNAKLLTTRNIYDMIKLVAKNVDIDINVVAQGYTDGYGVGELKYTSTVVRLSQFMNQQILEDIDISKYIVVEEIFNTLETLAAREYNYITMNNTNYKNNTLYWKRSSNEILNFNYYQSHNLDWLLKDDKTALEYALRSALYPLLNDILAKYKVYGTKFNFEEPLYWTVMIPEIYQEDLNLININTTWKNASFEVEYQPYSSIRMSVEKNKDIRHPVNLINNQTDSLVDIDTFGKQAQEKINQLGNDALEFSGHSLGTEIKYEIGQTFDDYVLTQLETTHDLDFTYYKGVLYKNFSNRNIYAILNRTKRYTSLIDNSESVVRHEIKKKYINVSLANPSNINNEVNKYLTISQYAIADVTNRDYEHLYCCGYPVFTNIGNSIIYTFEFMNNSSYGFKRGGTVTDTEYETIEYLKYVDDYGEIQDVAISFYDKPLNINSDFIKDFPKYTDNTHGNNLLFETGLWNIKKDNREHLKLSYNIIFKPTENIILGSAFSSILKDNIVYVHGTNTKVTETYNTDNLEKTLTYKLDGKTAFNFSEYDNYILFNDEGLVMAINNVGKELKYIVFN